MKKVLYIILVLTVLALVCGGILAIAYQQMLPLIQKNQRTAAQQAVLKVLPQAKNIKAHRFARSVYYEAFDEKGVLLGYALIREGSGYQGKIKLVAGLDAKLSKYTGVAILEEAEMRGIGDRIADAGFQAQFRGLQLGSPIKAVKNRVASQPNEIQAITGATISSQSVVDIINREVQSWLKAH